MQKPKPPFQLKGPCVSNKTSNNYSVEITRAHRLPFSFENHEENLFGMAISLKWLVLVYILENRINNQGFDEKHQISSNQQFRSLLDHHTTRSRSVAHSEHLGSSKHNPGQSSRRFQNNPKTHNKQVVFFKYSPWPLAVVEFLISWWNAHHDNHSLSARKSSISQTRQQESKQSILHIIRYAQLGL